MADFCKQCSIEIFGEDYEDLANLGPVGQLKEGQGWIALCESCGPITVDQDGTCKSDHCRKHGKLALGERKDFEQWAEAHGLKLEFKTEFGSEYLRPETNLAWHAWTARAKLKKSKHDVGTGDDGGDDGDS